MKKILLGILSILVVCALASCKGGASKQNIIILCSSQSTTPCNQCKSFNEYYSSISSKNIISCQCEDLTRDSYHPHIHYCIIYTD